MLILLAALVFATSAASAAPAQSLLLDWEEVSRRAHDENAFTQGLVLDDQGRLFESTGLWGSSTVREVDPDDGEVVRSRPLPDRHFGEGLALVDDELVQLTWRAGLARRFMADTFDLVGGHRYEGEGWGLCYDGERLVMSDGSDLLSFRDPDTFDLLGTVSVALEGRPLARLNELECVDGDVWANVWGADAIVRIEPSGGIVTGILDLTDLVDSQAVERGTGAVLNGIAYDAAADTFLVTGKLWPQLIEIRLVDSEA